MTDRLHRTVCAVVSEGRARHMAKNEGWQIGPALHLINDKPHKAVRKSFADNREIAAQLDGFANHGVTAWVE